MLKCLLLCLIVAFATANVNLSWKAAHNERFHGKSREEMNYRVVDEVAANLPEEYNPRDHYPGCWAVSLAGTLTDRFCIHSKPGTTPPYLSAKHIMSCCLGCVVGSWDGCHGGHVDAAWLFAETTGLVSGGEFGDTQDRLGCQPYPFAQCAHHSNSTKYPACPDMGMAPECERKCRAGSNIEFKEDKHKSHTLYLVVGEKAIMTELVKNGPVQAVMVVYEDFLAYKSGVYQPKEKFPLGGHAVEIMGYGTLDGVKYWRVKNSWNESWGLNGEFLILRGHDTAGLETGVVVAMPKI